MPFAANILLCLINLAWSKLRDGRQHWALTTRNLATHFTLSVRMISITSRVPTSSRPARASPSRMFASISKACEDMPAWTWSLNVARGVYVCERANIGSERMRSGTKGARRER